MNTRTAALAVTVIATTTLLTGCDTGPKCVESHTEFRTVTVTSYDNNGRPMVRPEVRVVEVCDRREAQTNG